MMQNKEKYILSPEENIERYNRIRKTYFLNEKNIDNTNKTAYYLGGQPGSGKTTVREQILNSSINPQNIIVLNTDDLREWHLEYPKLMANPETVNIASQLVNHDASIWFNKLKNEAIEKGYDIIFDSTLGTDNIQSFENGINELKGLGYKTELHVLAVPKGISKLGIHLRYEKQVNEKGFGRFVSMLSHDINYKNLSTNVEHLIDKNLFNAVSVYKKKMYKNEKGIILNNAFDLIHKSNTPQSIEILTFIKKGRQPIFNETETQYLKGRIKETDNYINKRSGNNLDFKNDTKELRDILKTKVIVKNKGLSM